MFELLTRRWSAILARTVTGGWQWLGLLRFPVGPLAKERAALASASSPPWRSSRKRPEEDVRSVFAQPNEGTGTK